MYAHSMNTFWLVCISYVWIEQMMWCYVFVIFLFIKKMYLSFSLLFVILKTAELQGVSVAWGIWHLLWSTLWKEHSLGDWISFWVYQRSSVCRKHYESSRMSFFGALSVHSPLVTGLYLHDSSGIERIYIYSCKDNLVITPTAKIVLGSIYLYAHNLQGACFAWCYWSHYFHRRKFVLAWSNTNIISS